MTGATRAAIAVADRNWLLVGGRRAGKRHILHMAMLRQVAHQMPGHE